MGVGIVPKQDLILAGTREFEPAEMVCPVADTTSTRLSEETKPILSAKSFWIKFAPAPESTRAIAGVWPPVP
jgi:hypothetical protein